MFANVAEDNVEFTFFCKDDTTRRQIDIMFANVSEDVVKFIFRS